MLGKECLIEILLECDPSKNNTQIIMIKIPKIAFNQTIDAGLIT